MSRKSPLRPYLISSDGAIVDSGGEDPIRLSCPACGKAVKVRREAAGKKGRCPECRHVFPIPDRGEAPALHHEKKIGNDDSLPEKKDTRGDKNEWDASVWKYYQHYIQNILPSGVEFGKHIKHIGFWWRCFQNVFDLVPAAVLLFVFRPDFQTDVSYSASVCGLIVLFQIILWSVLESSDFQGSLGKIVLDFKVVSKNGHQISFRRAFIRNLVKALMLATPLGVLFLLVGVDPKKRGLHDRIAKTMVVMESPTAFSWRNERRWTVLWGFAVCPFLVYFLFIL